MEILVVDIETANIDREKNNWDIENCLICEIGLVNLNLNSGRIKQIFNQTCREDKSPDPESWVFNNTSLSCKMIDESPHFEDFKDKLKEIFSSKPVTAWSHNFDLRTLASPPRCLEMPSIFWDPKCTLTHFLKIPLELGSGYKWPKVQEAFEYFYPNKKWQQKHRAIDDAKIEANIIFQAVETWPILKNEWEHFV